MYSKLKAVLEEMQDFMYIFIYFHVDSVIFSSLKLKKTVRDFHA